MAYPILEIRKHVTVEEIDYVYLMTTLQKWAAPRNVVSRLVKKGELVRIKKGIYIFGSDFAKRPYSLEILANKIYGPSYISQEYALSYWGIIPEKVKVVTSMTTGKNKDFSTPVGRFVYQSLDFHSFSIGVTYIKIGNTGALIATPEKALIDLLTSRKEKEHNADLLLRILFEDFRIEPEVFYGMDQKIMQQIIKIHPQSIAMPLLKLLKKRKFYA